ncbi:MAG TPA: phosphopyruvate hydratase [Methanocorpusculum sp.]|nr:phosphopyruvate hydratase [Methanocorpusculum sp.]
MTTIKGITLRRILDSRGNETIEAEILTKSGGYGRACAPSGASTGSYEAKVRPCIEAISDAQTRLIPELIDLDSRDQRTFDETLHRVDTTNDLSSIGSNIAVALSLANAKAAAATMNMELFQYLGGAFVDKTPLPLGNVIGGGAHAIDATDIQEFLIVPIGASNASEAIFTNIQVYKTIKEILVSRGKCCGMGDEGAWAPHISDTEAFEIIAEAANNVQDETGIDIRMGIDVASSEMWNDKIERYVYKDTKLTTEEQISYISELVEQYNLIYVEDPIQEEDFKGFAQMTEEVYGRDTLICGDDLFVTNAKRLEEGMALEAGNCVLIKPNQIGTLTETFETIRLAHEYDYETVMSHRSGETTDSTIAHLGTAFNCCFLKCGVVGGERIAKLNELIRIEEHF